MGIIIHTTDELESSNLEPLKTTVFWPDPTQKTVVCTAEDNSGRPLPDFKSEEEVECFDM